jgi:hypothetical protein
MGENHFATLPVALYGIVLRSAISEDIGVEINYALPKTHRDVAVLRLYIFSTMEF